MNTHPIISIIVPVFENSNNLTAHLNALQAQTETRWEAYYGFDGDLPNQLQAFKAQHLSDPRIHILQNGKPATIGDIFNTCLDAGEAENIITLHAEDALHSDALQFLTDEIAKTAGADYFYHLKRHLPNSEEAPEDHIPHDIFEMDEDLAAYGTPYFLYQRSVIHHYNLRFRFTNKATILEDFSETYSTLRPDSSGKAESIHSTFSPFTFPPAMEE